MGTGRFERVERARTKEAERPEAPSSLEARFAEGRADRPEAPARTGAEPARFEEAAPAGLRLLETDDGQAFVRCALCRADQHVASVRCGQCGALLATPEQRSFNQALFEALRAEQREEAAATAALRERQARAHAEQAEAFRRRQALETELERRRELGLPLDDTLDGRDPLRAGARWLGGLLGRTLVRLLPSRTARRAVLVAAGLGALALLALHPRGLAILAMLGLVAVGRYWRSRIRGGA